MPAIASQFARSSSEVLFVALALGLVGYVVSSIVIGASSFFIGFLGIGLTGLVAGLIALAEPRVTRRRLEEVSGGGNAGHPARYAGRFPDHEHAMPQAPNLHLGHDGGAVPEAFYVRRAEGHLVSTLHAQGAWQPGEQHLAAASALVLAEIERRLPSDKLVARVSFDVLGVILSGEFTIEVRVTRPGRTIELVEGWMRHGERVSVHARVWRLVASDTSSIQGIEWEPLPPPEAMPAFAFAARWDGGYVQSIEARQAADARPGRGRSWLRTRHALVAGETDPPTAAFVKLVDTANGLVVRASPGEVFFANVDLTLHFLRRPEAGWVGFDTRVSFGPSGLGETFTVLSDRLGPVGTAAQALTVRLGGTS